MALFSFAIYLIGTFASVFSQDPCTPLDAGEWIPVKPVLYLNIFEATEQELMLYPNDPMYQSELRLNGVIDENSPNGMILEPQGDFLIVNPAEIFKFETVSGHNLVRLFQPLDRDGPSESVDDDIDVITFSLKCSPVANRSIEVFYDVSILVRDKNDNPPTFVAAPYISTVNELIPVGTPVLTVLAVDKDSNLDDNITYSIVMNSGILNDGASLFEIDSQHGTISVKENLDYESLGDGYKYYAVRVLVEDGGPNPKLSAYTDVKIYLSDGNDHGPSFIYPGCHQHKMLCIWPKYTTDINAVTLNKEIGFHGYPDTTGNEIIIQAKDMDAVPSNLTFSIAATYPPGYNSYFTVETMKTGNYYKAIVKQVKTMDKMSIFELFIKAEELSPEKRFEVAKVSFEGNTIGSSNPPTTPSPNMNTEAQTADKTTDNSSTEEFSTTTVALIVVVAVTLTLVLCLAVAMACLSSRRHQYSSDKAPLTTINGGHDNRGYSAQL